MKSIQENKVHDGDRYNYNNINDSINNNSSNNNSLYPYGLLNNPFPSSPTPTLHNSKILGGKRHREARDAIINCINDLYSKVSKDPSNSIDDFRVITVVQDIGAGKTHLALHIKSIVNNAVCSYLDLSTISPKTLQGLFAGLLKGFAQDYLVELRSKIIKYIKHHALQGNKYARKFFRASFFNNNIEKLAGEVINGSRYPDIRYLSDIFSDYNKYEVSLIRKIINDEFYNVNDITSLEEMLAMLDAIASINMKFLNKLTLLEIDEFDSNTDSMDFVKALINAHTRSTILLLITTPSIYDTIRSSNPSLFDRLEKANYKIDLVGSSTFDEVVDIALEYIRVNVKDLTFSMHEHDLAGKIKVIYDEFVEFRNIRSLLNILYHAMESAKFRNEQVLTEDAIEDAIRHAYPGLRVRGSIMNVPIAEFMRIRREYNANDVESAVKQAVKNLLTLLQENGKVSRVEYDVPINGVSADASYFDNNMKRSMVVVMLNKDYVSMKDLYHEGMSVDRLLVLNNSGINSSNGLSIVNLDKRKVVDLIYFNQKYSKKEISDLEIEKALLLARSILLY
jgi:hypothetical protein